MRCGFVVIPATEAGKLTLDELCELVARTKRVRKHWRIAGTKNPGW